jgi:hypothetical protein
MPTYTTADDIVRVLRANADGKVRTSSEALKAVEVRDSQKDFQILTTVDQSGITIATSFQGQKKLKFDFTDATNFNVSDIDGVAARPILLGTGDISTEYSDPDEIVTVAAGTFGGTIAAGDSITIVLDCHISSDDVDLFIEDAEIEVDAVMTEGGLGYLDTAAGQELIYEDEVPPAVRVITTYLAAYYLYSDVYASSFKDEKAAASSFTMRWKRRAEHLLKTYIKAQRRSVPTVLSFPSYVDKFGVRGVGPGTDGLAEDADDILRDSYSEYTNDGEYVTSKTFLVDAE